MKYIDVNCMVGGWPFHRVRNSTFEDLKRMHAKVGIEGGLVSSTDAIFWNDPYEADRILAETLKGQDAYKHIMTINPTLVGWRDDLDRAEKEFSAVGVRIVPGFHGYTLDHPEVQALAEELAKRGMLMMVNIHMEDERVAYLLKHRPLPVDEVRAFIAKNPNLFLLLANIRIGEVEQLKDIIAANDNLFFDISGFKDRLFVINDMLDLGVAEHACYGSMSPLFCISSTHLLIAAERISPSDAAMIQSASAFVRKLGV